jgi:hypothetical protein
MNMLKRGLLALSVVAAAGGTTAGLLASQASAQSTRGSEIIRSTQYEVGSGEAVGPWTGHGVLNTHGNVTDIPSLTTDPANSNRHTLVDPTGSFTVMTTGGSNPQFSQNPVTCAVRFSVRDIDATIVSGTGAYANATGHLKANVVVNGYAPRLADGSCDQNAETTAFEVDNVVAVGHINLHGSSTESPS